MKEIILDAKEIKPVNAKEEKSKPNVKMNLVEDFTAVLDNMPENPDSLLIMFPWITPWFPYGDAWMCKNTRWKVEWLETYN